MGVSGLANLRIPAETVDGDRHEGPTLIGDRPERGRYLRVQRPVGHEIKKGGIGHCSPFLNFAREQRNGQVQNELQDSNRGYRIQGIETRSYAYRSRSPNSPGQSSGPPVAPPVAWAL